MPRWGDSRTHAKIPPLSEQTFWHTDNILYPHWGFWIGTRLGGGLHAAGAGMLVWKSRIPAALLFSLAEVP